MVGFLKTENRIIEYDIVYCNRKSLSIKLDEKGNIFVRAPKGLSEQQTEKILRKKASWIITHQDSLQKLSKEKEEKRYLSGTVVYYKGEKYSLHIAKVDDKKKQKIVLTSSIENKMDIFTVYLDEKYIKNFLEMWYKEEARRIITEKVNYYESFFNRSYGNIRIKSMKTRWGSCSTKGNLNFNWKIIMAPEEVIDYLVVHELSHLLEMNHSSDFYKQLSRVLPNYKTHQKWLKENEKYLDI